MLWSSPSCTTVCTLKPWPLQGWQPRTEFRRRLPLASVHPHGQQLGVTEEDRCFPMMPAE